MAPSHSGGWGLIFLIYPGTSRHTDILRVLPSCTQTHIDTSLHFPLDMFMYLWDNFGLISLQCFCSHYCINTVHSPGTLWWGLLIVGVTVFWADGIVSWGIPVVSLRLSFYTGQIQSIRYFLLGGGIRPGCLHYGSSLRKEGWWCSECVLNPFIFDRAPYPHPYLYLISSFAGCSVVLSLEMKLPVLCLGWREALGEGWQLPSHMKYWRGFGDLITC